MENKKLIYVDGPARSGSTYLCRLFVAGYGSDPFGASGVSVNFHATHEASVYELLSILKPESPLVVSIRDPKDNVVSAAIHKFWNSPSPENLNLIQHASNLESHLLYLVRNPEILAIPFEVFTKNHELVFDIFDAMFPEFSSYRKESVTSEKIIKDIENLKEMEKNPEAYIATSSVPRKIELEYYTKAREAIYRQIEEIPSVALAVERASIPYRRLVERFSVLVEKYKN